MPKMPALFWCAECSFKYVLPQQVLITQNQFCKQNHELPLAGREGVRPKLSRGPIRKGGLLLAEIWGDCLSPGLAAHRIPPQLLGIVPSNTGGVGAVLPAAQVFARNEIKPLQDRFREINEWIGDEVVRFTDYEVPKGEATAAP